MPCDKHPRRLCPGKHAARVSQVFSLVSELRKSSASPALEDGTAEVGQVQLLEMFAALEAPQFDTEDARAFCRLFAACVRAGLAIMFDKPFMRGSRLTEAQFHDELERRLRADPELGGRLTRRDRVAGGFDDLLHDDIIAELKVSRGAPVTLDSCARYIGQPAQYGTGRGSQTNLAVLAPCPADASRSSRRPARETPQPDPGRRRVGKTR